MDLYFLLHVVSIISMTLPGVLGYNLIFGKGKIFHFGPIGTSLLAGYSTYLTLVMTGNVFLALAVCILLVSTLALLFVWLSLRLDADGLGILTIAGHLMLLSLALNWTELTGGSLGVTGIPRLPMMESMGGFACVSVTIAALWCAAMFLLERRPFGRTLSALGEHDWHAQALGISRLSVYVVTFMIGSAGLMISEWLFPAYLRFLHPSNYSFSTFIFMLMCVVAGKPGSMKGVALSTCLLILLREGLRFLPLTASMVGPLRLILFGTILLGAVYIRRDTLFPAPRQQ